LVVDLESEDVSMGTDLSSLIPVHLAHEDRVQIVRADGPRCWLRFDRQTVNPAELIAAIAAQRPLRDVAIEEPAIEDIVRRIYGEGIDAGIASGAASQDLVSS
jgi:ABC-type uncharacterized transport system ATPase subunit